eukprot:3694592-Alexandrium_andersonii.AAC.1
MTNRKHSKHAACGGCKRRWRGPVKEQKVGQKLYRHTTRTSAPGRSTPASPAPGGRSPRGRGRRACAP